METPLLVVLVVGCAFVAYQWWWISNSRMLGALDVDEAGSIATSLEFHRALTHGPGQLLHAFFGTASGPLVPLLSVPFLAVFGRSANTAMYVQPVLVLLSAIGVSGAVRQMAGRYPAVLAGCVTLAMPALITSSRTDQFSNGVGAAMCLGMWALLASRRLDRTGAVVAFGLACGAMTISRTMSVSFLPAMAIAALVVGNLRSPKAWRNLGLACAAAMVVAVPWWWHNWDAVSSYLQSSGYGPRASLFGSATMWGRLLDHIGYLRRDFHPFMPIGLFFTVLGAVTALRGLSRGPRSWFRRNRDLVAVWAAISLGTAALLSSANRGVWFATPLDSLLVIAVVTTGDRVLRRSASLQPREFVAIAMPLLITGMMVSRSDAAEPGSMGLFWIATPVLVVALILSRWKRRAAATGLLVLGICGATIVASTPLLASLNRTAIPLAQQMVTPIEWYNATSFENDPRLTTIDMTARHQAAQRWVDAALAVDRQLGRIAGSFGARPGDQPELVFTGSRGLFDVNTFKVAVQLHGRFDWPILSPLTYQTPDRTILDLLRPVGDDGMPRTLVVVGGRSSPFPDDIGWHRVVVLAERAGWTRASSVPLPDGGRVDIYTPSSTARR